MKRFFTLLLVCVSLLANSQQEKVAAPPNCKGLDSITVYVQPKIVIRCRATDFKNEPLLVVDGIPFEYNQFQKTSPDDIESIEILKETAASVLWGCRAARGAIIITTKSSKLRKFIIKDFLGGKTIPGATVKFKSLKNKNDSLVLAANDSGFVLTNKLKAGIEYEIQISSVGFKPYRSQFKNTFSFDEQIIFLERKNTELKEVVIMSNAIYRRISCGMCITVIRCCYTVPDTTKETSAIKIYPNPLPRGSNINIELTSEILAGSSIRVFSLSGALMHQEKISTSKWKTITIASDKRWTVGTYIVQLINEKGKSVGQQKIIVQ
jgi:TonB-dependent SusC/RagA subfamily outer membrane receptor